MHQRGDIAAEKIWHKCGRSRHLHFYYQEQRARGTECLGLDAISSLLIPGHTPENVAMQIQSKSSHINFQLTQLRKLITTMWKGESNLDNYSLGLYSQGI